MGRLTIQEIAKVLVAKNGLEQSEANRFATELFAIIQECLEKNDLVKVKGLGTFKVITVEARESVSVRTGGRVMIGEHSKITFTPDAMMKELVNKPFSQFETVVLNDNVEFDDLKEQPDEAEFEDSKDDLTEGELEQEQFEQVEEPQVTPIVAPLIEVAEEPVEEPVEESVEEPVEKPIDEPIDEPVEEPVEEMSEEVQEEVSEPVEEPIEEADVTEMSEEASEEADDETVEETDEEADEEDESVNWFKWIWLAFGAICLIGISAAGGYYYGCRHMALAALSDTVFVRDTVYVSENKDTATVEVPEVPDVKEETPKVETPKAEAPKEETPKAAEVKVEKPKAEPTPEIDKYAQKDERVRLGAYRIVGLDHEVKVLQGQTFYSICRAHLGPDMECYIEVYNDLPRNPQVKAGQVIKIPKLQLKKRKK